jgi:imidazolonepropionase-like amidohydrolase
LRTASASVAVLAALCAWLTARGAEAPQPRTLVFVGATLIDGTGRAPQRNAVVLVQGERIVSVQSAAHFRPPEGAEVVTLTGRFLIPGLINTHVHLATLAKPAEARAYLRRELYSGVTAVRDMAGDVRLLAELKREAAFAEIPAPDIYYAALMAGPGFFADERTHDAARGLAAGDVPWMRAVSASTDLPRAIAEARGSGATAIKIYADLPAPLVAAITGEAHRQGLLVWAHAAVFPATPLEVADAGVDVMSHATFIAYQLADPMPQSFAAMTPLSAKAAEPSPALDAVLGAMQRRGILLDATVDVFYRYPSKLWAPQLGAQVTREAHRLGVAICAGTDDDADWSDPDSALDTEIARLVRDAGLAPMEALVAATGNGARALGQEASMGTVAAGKLANFVILERDPLADVGNLRSVLTVVKHGVQYPRSAYHPVTAEEMKGAASP